MPRPTASSSSSLLAVAPAAAGSPPLAAAEGPAASSSSAGPLSSAAAELAAGADVPTAVPALEAVAGAGTARAACSAGAAASRSPSVSPSCAISCRSWPMTCPHAFCLSLLPAALAAAASALACDEGGCRAKRCRVLSFHIHRCPIWCVSRHLASAMEALYLTASRSAARLVLLHGCRRLQQAARTHAPAPSLRQSAPPAAHAAGAGGRAPPGAAPSRPGRPTAPSPRSQTRPQTAGEGEEAAGRMSSADACCRRPLLPCRTGPQPCRSAQLQQAGQGGARRERRLLALPAAPRCINSSGTAASSHGVIPWRRQTMQGRHGMVNENTHCKKDGHLHSNRSLSTVCFLLPHASAVAA